MGLTETWLHERYLEAELAIDNYTVFRSDRDLLKKKRRGRHSGGVAIYIRNDLASTTDTQLSFTNGAVEIIATHSKIDNLLLVTVYRQPDDSAHGRPSSANEFKHAITALKRAIHNLEYTPDIIIGGDFNLPNISWPECLPTEGCAKDERDMIEILREFTNDLLLTQIVREPTHYQGSTLDLVFTNNDSLIHSHEILPTPLSVSHHQVVNIYSQYKSPKLPSDVEENPRLSPFDNLNFHSKDVDWETIMSTLSEVEWESEMSEMTIDKILEIIYSKSLEAVTDNVPNRKRKVKNASRQKRQQINLARRRRRVNKRYQRITSPAGKAKLYKELIQIEVKLQKLQNDSNEYKERKACEAIKDNFKYFFSYANKKRKVKSNVGPLQDLISKTMITDSKEMAESLADQYSSVFSIPNHAPPTINSSTNSDTLLSDVSITPDDIIAAIDELRASAASGPDGFPAILLKNCKHELAIPLAIMWNKSMETSYIPSSLQFNLITPNHKGGSKSIQANYRPVALTSHLIKIYEKVLRNKIAAFLASKNLLNKNQHGFRAGRSCLTQLIAHHDHILSLLEEGFNVDVVYLDFAKAFDKVDHNLVLKKAQEMGIDGKLLSWLQEFLQNRTQSVVVNGKVSSPRPVISGVQQGSVLGPLIFLILIADIDEDIHHSLVASFADDTRVKKGLKSESDAADLQNDLFRIYQWSEKNNMQFNAVKFELMRYGKDNELKGSTSYVAPNWELMEEKDYVKDLGITMSNDCSFKVHINNVIESAKRISSWILRTFRTRDRIPMLTLYKSLVRPILEYCSALWAPTSKGEIQRLEEIQQSFLRKINGLSKDYHMALKETNLYSLERRRERYIIIHLWKMLEGIVPNLGDTDTSSVKLQSQIQTRRGRTCQIHLLDSTPTHLHKAKQQTVKCFGVKLFNSLPKQIRNITGTDTNHFKSALDLFLKRVEDKPLLRSHANNGSYNNSNHLFDIINPLDVEHITSGASNIPQPGEATNTLPSRRPAAMLAIWST